MKKYRVEWSKTYHRHGEEFVEAESNSKAEEIVRARLGDLVGSMQYDADADMVDAWEE